MGKGGYYLVTEGGAPAVEEVPGGGKAAIVCERPGLAEEGETLEAVSFDDLAFLLEARADVGYVRVRAPGGTRTIDKSDFLGETLP